MISFFEKHKRHYRKIFEIEVISIAGIINFQIINDKKIVQADCHIFYATFRYVTSFARFSKNR